GQTASAPVTELQRRVAESMAAVLGLPEVSAEQNFFELGGHSLLAARLATNLISVAGRRPSLREIFEAPTPAALAAALADQDAAANQPLEAPSIPVRSDQSTAPLSQMQQRLWFLENLNPGTVVHNIPSAHRLSGPLDGAALDQAFRLLVDRQSVLRTVIERSADGGR